MLSGRHRTHTSCVSSRWNDIRRYIALTRCSKQSVRASKRIRHNKFSRHRRRCFPGTTNTKPSIDPVDNSSRVCIDAPILCAGTMSVMYCSDESGRGRAAGATMRLERARTFCRFYRFSSIAKLAAPTLNHFTIPYPFPNILYVRPMLYAASALQPNDGILYNHLYILYINLSILYAYVILIFFSLIYRRCYIVLRSSESTKRRR